MIQSLVSLAFNHFVTLSVVGFIGAAGGLASLFLIAGTRDQTKRRIGFYVGYCSLLAILVAAIPLYCANLAHLRADTQHSY